MRGEKTISISGSVFTSILVSMWSVFSGCLVSGVMVLLVDKMVFLMKPRKNTQSIFIKEQKYCKGKWKHCKWII